MMCVSGVGGRGVCVASYGRRGSLWVRVRQTDFHESISAVLPRFGAIGSLFAVQRFWMRKVPRRFDEDVASNGQRRSPALRRERGARHLIRRYVRGA